MVVRDQNDCMSIDRGRFGIGRFNFKITYKDVKTAFFMKLQK